MNVNAETEDATLLLDGLLQNVAIIRFDTNKKVTYANALFAEAMGYSEEEMLTLSHPDLCFPDFVQSASYKAMWTNLLAGQKFQNKIERKMHAVNVFGLKRLISRLYVKIRSLE